MRHASVIQVLILDDRDFIQRYQNFSPNQSLEMLEFIKDCIRKDDTRKITIMKIKRS